MEEVLIWITQLFALVFFVVGNNQSLFACSPGVKRVDGGVSISTDGGKTFAHRTIADGLGSDRILGIFASAKNVYVATDKGLAISSDGGASFVNKTTLDGLGSDFVFEVFARGQKVYVATNKGLAISTDGGISFVNKTTLDGLGSNEVNAVVVSDQNIYVATYGGLSISTDGGASFVNRTVFDGLGSNRVRGISVRGKTLYVATSGSSLQPLPRVNGGLSISNDGGATFKNIPVDFDNFGYSLLSEVFSDERNIYVVNYNNAFVSPDGGSSFTGLGNLSKEIRFFGMQAFFANSSRVYVAMPRGLFISTDGGKKFTKRTASVFPNWKGETKISAIFADGQRLYLAAVKLKQLSSAVCDDLIPAKRPQKFFDGVGVKF